MHIVQVLPHDVGRYTNSAGFETQVLSSEFSPFAGGVTGGQVALKTIFSGRVSGRCNLGERISLVRVGNMEA
jgi:hypothetical protein